MSRLTKPQKRIQTERNNFIFKLYDEGMSYPKISVEVEKKYGVKITRQRVKQIIVEMEA